MPPHTGHPSAHAGDHDDPFYAPTNLATRLRNNPQPRLPPAPSVAGTAEFEGAPDQVDKTSEGFKPSAETAGPKIPLPRHPGSGHASHSPTDSLAMILVGLVVVLLLALKGASGGSAALRAENARLIEERGQFVVSLMDWSQRLLEADPPWLHSANETLVWSYGYTSLEPLPRPPLAPLPVKVHEAAFSAVEPLVFPPPNLKKSAPRIVGLEVSLAVEAEQAEVPRYGWWRATELLALGGERVVLQAVPPPVVEVKYFARVFYFIPT